MRPQHGNAPDRWQRTEARGLQKQRPIYTPTAGRPYSGRHRLPPYGATLAAVLADPAGWRSRLGTSADGRHLTLWVLAGPDCWDVARQWERTRALYVLSPPDETPDAFDWSLLAGHAPTLLRPCPTLTQAEIAELVAALVGAGCERILVVGPEALRLYRGGCANG